MITSIWKNKKKSEITSNLNYLYRLSEKIFEFLAVELNKFHKTSHSKRFWKIILFQWLLFYSNFYYQRWEESKKVLKKKFIPYKNFEKRNSFVNSESILRLIYNKDYSQKILQSIIEKKNLNIKKKNKKKFIKIKNILDEKKKFKIKDVLIKFYNFLNFKRYKYFIFHTQLGYKREALLGFKLFQLPIFSYKILDIKSDDYDFNFRQNLKSINKFKNNLFEKSLFESICEELPKCFIENFKNMSKLVDTTNFPKNPKIIFSSYILAINSFLNFYVAKKVESGSKLFYYQHGGSYGCSNYHYQEKHEIELSDRFFSWGWKKKKNVKILGSPYVKKKLTYSNKNNILLVFKSIKIQSKGVNIGSSIEPIDEYFLRQKELMFKLKDLNIEYSFPKKHIETLNVYDKNYNFIVKNFKNCFGKKFYEKISRYNLIINSDNSTPFLETMFYKVPNILVINNKYNDCCQFSKNFYEPLIQNNIIYFSNNKAVNFLNKIIKSNGINEWWSDRKVQYSVNKFNENYVKFNESLIKELKNNISN